MKLTFSFKNINNKLTAIKFENVLLIMILILKNVFTIVFIQMCLSGIFIIIASNNFFFIKTNY